MSAKRKQKREILSCYYDNEFDTEVCEGCKYCRRCQELARKEDKFFKIFNLIIGIIFWAHVAFWLYIAYLGYVDNGYKVLRWFW